MTQGLDRVLRRLVGQERRQQLRVRAGREAAATTVELAQQLAGVDEVAVVPDGERPPRPEAERRLGVLPDRGAGRRVAAVRDREVPGKRRAAAARRGPARSSRGPCRASAAAPSLTATPADSWPRCWSANSPSAATAAASVAAVRAGRPRTRHTSAPSGAEAVPAERAGKSVLPGVRAGPRPGRRGHRRPGCRAPRRRRWRPAPTSSMTRRGPPTDAERLDRQSVLAGEQLERRRVPRPGRDHEPRRALAEQVHRRRVARRRCGPGPRGRPTSRIPPGRPRGHRPTRPGPIATRPRAIASRMNAWSARSAPRSRVGRSVLDGDPGEPGVLAAGQAGRRRARRAGSRRRRRRMPDRPPSRRRRAGPRRRSPASAAMAPVGASL